MTDVDGDTGDVLGVEHIAKKFGALTCRCESRGA